MTSTVSRHQFAHLPPRDRETGGHICGGIVQGQPARRRSCRVDLHATTARRARKGQASNRPPPHSVGGGRVTQREARLETARTAKQHQAADLCGSRDMEPKPRGGRPQAAAKMRTGTQYELPAPESSSDGERRYVTRRGMRTGPGCPCRRETFHRKMGPRGQHARIRQVHGKEATKGAWWMPGHLEATKDVANCDMRRVAVREHSIRRFPNGATRWPNKPSHQRERGEVKHLSNRRKRNQPRFPQ